MTDKLTNSDLYSIPVVKFWQIEGQVTGYFYLYYFSYSTAIEPAVKFWQIEGKLTG